MGRKAWLKGGVGEVGRQGGDNSPGPRLAQVERFVSAGRKAYRLSRCREVLTWNTLLHYAEQRNPGWLGWPPQYHLDLLRGGALFGRPLFAIRPSSRLHLVRRGSAQPQVKPTTSPTPNPLLFIMISSMPPPSMPPPPRLTPPPPPLQALNNLNYSLIEHFLPLIQPLFKPPPPSN